VTVRPGARALAAAVAAALLLWTSSALTAEPGRTLSISGTRFAVDGTPRFVVGVSLFDALGRAGVSDADLDALAQWRVDLVRVWAHWSEPIYAADGALTPDGRGRLLGLAERLRSRGLLLELVLLRPGQLPGQAYAAFSSPAARVRAVREIATALRPYRGICFDLYNEHDHRDGPISHAEARGLRDAVKSADSARVVTISSTEYHFFDARGVLLDSGVRNLREEIDQVGVDAIAPHLPRTADWADTTSARLTALVRALAELGHPMPVYLNEERRAESGQMPLPRSMYLAALAAASAAGAAGWVLHTSAGYALGQSSFVSALNPEERATLQAIGAAPPGGTGQRPPGSAPSR
jgi:hypothetical protein